MLLVLVQHLKRMIHLFLTFLHHLYDYDVLSTSALDCRHEQHPCSVFI